VREAAAAVGHVALRSRPRGKTTTARSCRSPTSDAALRSSLGNDDRVVGGAVRRLARVHGGGRRGGRPYPPPPGTFARAAGGATSPPQYTPRSPLSPVPARAKPRVSRP
jgi:hypothetical protein